MLHKSKVWFLPIEKLNDNNLVKLFTTAGFDKIFSPGDIAAIKVHFGEPGNTAYLKPQNVKPIAEKLIGLGARPFLTDSNTLYKGKRSNAVDHVKTACSHGYDFAPIIIADGLHGKEYEKVVINGGHFKEVNIGAAARQADSLMVMTHFKGHEVTGFGGAIKNAGMGLGSRSGKQQMHADVSPQVDSDKCTGCELCTKWCPVDAISMDNGKALIDTVKCIGCAECVVTCQFNAIEISWAGTPNDLQEKMAEYALGAVKSRKCAYMSFINDVSPNCDCYSHNDPPIVGDIGVLASLDPVAIDQAAVDLVNKTAGHDIIKKTWPDIDYTVQLKYGEKIGLGSREYELEILTF